MLKISRIMTISVQYAGKSFLLERPQVTISIDTVPSKKNGAIIISLFHMPHRTVRRSAPCSFDASNQLGLFDDQ